MKNFVRLLSVFLLAGVLASCEKKIEQINYEGGTPPVLTADRTTIPLSFVTRNDVAVKFSWTNPDYKFTTGLSSQDVSYLLQIGVDGTNFSPVKEISLSKDLTYTFTQGELNDYLLNKLNLTPAQTANVEFRITSTLVNNSIPLRSNSLKYALTPYAIPPKVTPPASGQLFLVGSATPGGWNNPVPVPSQKFTQVSPTFYSLTVQIIGGGSFLFLPVNGDWSAKFGYTGSNNANNPNGDDFKPQGGDMLAPSASGTYRVDVDFQKGIYTMTKL